MVVRSTQLEQDVLQTSLNQNFNIGIKITVGGADINLTKVTKFSGGTEVICRIVAGNGTTVLDTQTYSGDDATFDITLSASTDYFIMSSKTDSTFNAWRDNSETFPNNMTEASLIAGGVGTTTDASRAWSIDSVTWSTSVNKTILPSALTLSLTDTEPLYLIQITSGAQALASTVLSPTISIMNPVSKTILPSALNLSLSLLQSEVILPSDTRVVGTGSRGSRFIRTSYPVDKGLGIDQDPTGIKIGLTPKISHVGNNQKVGLF